VESPGPEVSEASPTHGVTLTRGVDGENLVIRVAETGVGIAEKALGRILDEFFRSASDRVHLPLQSKVYRVDAWGFLVDPAEWDALYASNKAREMKLPVLSEKHWRVLDSLRTAFEETGTVPTVFECCKANGLELEELESLFPDGYHRGAVKIAGLCVRPGGGGS
jgi:tRNA 2-thiouridine synthesizing protein E